MKRRQIIMFVERDDDLDFAWFYYARGWDGVKLMHWHHGHWSWLCWKYDRRKTKKGKTVD